MLLLQHPTIKTSFEKSKMVVQYNFRLSMFREFCGNIFITALGKILDETKLAGFIGIDLVAYECQLSRFVTV